MSAALEHQMREDRIVRDAARAVLHADVAHLKASLAERSIPGRVADRISEGAHDALDEAVYLADEHKGVLATVAAALVLWFARHPLMDLVRGEDKKGLW